jgi:integrase
VASDYLASLRENGRATATLKKNEWFLSLLKPIWERPIREITPRELRDVLRQIIASGRHDTAVSLRGFVSSVYRHAILDDLADSDPSFPLRRTLPTPNVKHHAAIISANEFGGLLRAIQEYDGQPTTHAALKLMAYLFPRPGELRHAEWGEFNLDEAIWIIPAARTKMRREHFVPLAPQAVVVLLDLRRLTGRGKLVFPGLRTPDRPISENTLNAALRRLGYSKDQATAHGFRATASTLLNESGKWNADAVERQLAHIEANKVRKAYQRGEFWEERVRMMKWWADHIDMLRESPKAIVSPAQPHSGIGAAL